MSKELIGKNGYVFGSENYFKKLNSKYFIDEFLQISQDYKYYDALTAFSRKIKSILEEIYSDVRKNAKILSFVSSSERSNLIEIVKGLDGICRLARNTTSDVNNLIYLLDLRSSETKLQSGVGTSEIDNAVRVIKNSSKVMMSASDRVSLVKKAISSGVKSATGSDTKKAEFLKEVLHGRDTKFLTDVLNKHNFDTRRQDYRGRNGKVICSKDYCDYILKECFVRTQLKFMGSSDRNYAEAIKNQFDKVVGEINSDLYTAKTNNDFVKDENGIFFKKAIFELEKCGIKCYDLCNKINDFMWYVGGDPAKIKELQCKLNYLGISGQSGRLKEDGVYGKETLSAWNKFFEKLVKGALPTLAWVDPLQTKKTGITYKFQQDVSKPKPGSGIYDHYEMKKLSDPYDYSVLLIKKEGKDKPDRLFMFDKPHIINGKGKKEEAVGYHMNFDKAFSDSVRKKFDHKQIPEDVYLRLKNFGETAKKVRVAGKVLLVANIALDVIELCKTIDADLKDSDKKLGRKTASNVAEIGGSWGGSIALAELGAYAGTLAGPFAPIAVPVLSFVGGIAGSFVGDALSKYIIDITYVGE